MGTLPIKVVGCAATVIAAASAYPALETSQPKLVGIVVLFSFLGVFLLLFSGDYLFDQAGVTHRNTFGQFRMQWVDVVRAQHNQGQLVLYGDKGHFVITPATYWSGRDKVTALQFMLGKLEQLEIAPMQHWSAATRLHKNARVKRPETAHPS